MKFYVLDDEPTIMDLARKGLGKCDVHTLESKLLEAKEEILFLSDARDAVFRSNRKLALAVEAIDMAINESDVFTYYEIIEKLRGVKERLSQY